MKGFWDKCIPRSRANGVPTHISIVKALRRPVGNYLTVFQSVIPKLIDYKLSICFWQNTCLWNPFYPFRNHCLLMLFPHQEKALTPTATPGRLVPGWRLYTSFL